MDAAEIETEVVSAPNLSTTGTTNSPAMSSMIKLANLSTPTESDGDDAGEHAGTSTALINTSSSSPPPNCAICLSRCKNKCFTDSCLHQFCFKCLCEWSKIKPECPLCKQHFTEIIHNVRSEDQYDRYDVQPNPQFVDRTLGARFLWGDHSNVLVPPPRYPIIVSEPHTRNASLQILDIPRNTASRYEPYRQELMNLYRENDEDHVGSLSHLWRRYVYDRKLYALSVVDIITGQFRDCSARFYRDNPAQIHRLMPFINRDVMCLLRNSPLTVATEVIELISSILPICNILDPTFRRRLTPFLGERTSHFVHELFNFARSPYDIIGYDRVVQYSVMNAEEITINFLSSDEDEHHASSEEPANSNRPLREGNSSTSVIIRNPSGGSAHSFSVSLSNAGLVLPSRSAIRNAISSSQLNAINLSIHGRDGEIIEIDDNDLDGTADEAANAEVAAINNQNSRIGNSEVHVVERIDLDSSDNENDNSSGNTSDCLFVLERKPPHLRTPELVSLNSDSDSDVIFIDEKLPVTVLRNKNLAVSKNISQTENNQECGLYMGASTSTGLRSNWADSRERKRKFNIHTAEWQQQREKITRHKVRKVTNKDKSATTNLTSNVSSGNNSSSLSSSESGSVKKYLMNSKKKIKKARKRMRRVRSKLLAKNSKYSTSTDTDSSQDMIPLNTLKATLLVKKQFENQCSLHAACNDINASDMVCSFGSEEADAANVIATNLKTENTKRIVLRLNAPACSDDISNRCPSTSSGFTSTAGDRSNTVSSIRSRVHNSSTNENSVEAHPEYASLNSTAATDSGNIINHDQEYSSNTLGVLETTKTVFDVSMADATLVEDELTGTSGEILQNYANSLIEDARLPIYSELSNDISVQASQYERYQENEGIDPQENPNNEITTDAENPEPTGLDIQTFY